jgi:hypothetical protein
MLSESALAQMRLHMEESGIRVDDSNREAYRELARAGIMYPVSTFARGPEAYFRFTDDGWERRHEILATVLSVSAAAPREFPCCRCHLSSGIRGLH